ncbi:hypothetical protein JGH11_18500 [Dysgonomonas sp. Marseille-P4677]|uniref:hypothetical protein n=1 Tax=Dysgonomonas sp. Marseille-P4677 TaxID=2364790 RepID=UPI001913B13E|nr:hypothetical protein [Dysgonomonas sp. Marseille-P4677]MBK5722865.1 hypothetical protein [Dysgonomonas sp. Marseille-P4677]
MKNIIFLLILGLISCASKPKGFSYRFNGKETGLENLIDINGYYIINEKNSMYCSVFMFYENGLFRFANTSESGVEKVLTSFSSEEKEFYSFIPWGTYYFDNDTIYTQYIQERGLLYGSYILNRNYKILPNKKIICIYYSNNENITEINVDSDTAKFHPLKSKRDWRECPWLKKKWFTEIPK